jgi:hypothetical protein
LLVQCQMFFLSYDLKIFFGREFPNINLVLLLPKGVTQSFAFFPLFSLFVPISVKPFVPIGDNLLRFYLCQ